MRAELLRFFTFILLTNHSESSIIIIAVLRLFTDQGDEMQVDDASQNKIAPRIRRRLPACIFIWL